MTCWLKCVLQTQVGSDRRGVLTMLASAYGGCGVEGETGAERGGMGGGDSM